MDLEALQRVFKQLDTTNRGKIGPDDLARAFQRLEYEPPAVTDFGNSEIEDMIWEVDEDADGFIDWPNFVLLYGRARCDQLSKEPRRFFNLIDFMTWLLPLKPHWAQPQPRRTHALDAVVASRIRSPLLFPARSASIMPRLLAAGTSLAG